MLSRKPLRTVATVAAVAAMAGLSIGGCNGRAAEEGGQLIEHSKPALNEDTKENLLEGGKKVLEHCGREADQGESCIP